MSNGREHPSNIVTMVARSAPGGVGIKYAPFYCEENVFHLARSFAADLALAGRRREVVFISNETRACAIFHQRAALHAAAPVLWDYHVVLLTEGPWAIWDLDTTLAFPCDAPDYLIESFRPTGDERHRPRFRVVEADLFAREFASDRSHMRQATGEYLKEPPPWSPIGAPGAKSNLDRFVDMTTPFLGEVLGLSELLNRVRAPSR